MPCDCSGFKNSKMKLVVVLLCALLFAVSAKVTPRIGESKITEIVEGIVNRLCHGVPSMGIPILEPFQQLQPVDVNLNHSMAEVNGQISHIVVAGISGFKLVKVKGNAQLQFNFEIAIPKVKASGKFKLKGSLGGLFPIDGDGSFDIAVSGIKLIASGRPGLTENSTLRVAELKAQPSINKIDAKIVNLVPNKEVNDFINKILNEMGPKLLDDLWMDIGEDVLKEIEELSKSLLAGLTMKDLTKIIFGNAPVFGPDDPAPNCPPVVIP